MLKEALDEMLHGEGAGFELAGVCGAVLKGDLGGLQAATMINGDESPVADGNAVDVGSQVFEGSLPVAHPLAMDDPFSSPDFWGNFCIENRSAQSALEGSAEQFGEGFHRQEKISARRQPPLSVAPYSATGDQIVDVGMVEQVAGPGVEYTYHADLPAHKFWISGQFLGCLGRSTKEQVVDQLLVVAGEQAQFSGEGESQQEVRDG